MRKVSWVLPLLVVTGLGVYGIRGGEPQARAATPKVNACGCYRDVAGACFCGKANKGKCDCPGDCEPKGCDEKRAKQLDKEVEAEIKRARDTEKKQRDAELDRRKKSEAVNNDEEKAAEARLEAAEAESREAAAADAKAQKKVGKGKTSSKTNSKSGQGDDSTAADARD